VAIDLVQASPEILLDEGQPVSQPDKLFRAMLVLALNIPSAKKALGRGCPASDIRTISFKVSLA
jgi:hypothetical protein